MDFRKLLIFAVLLIGFNGCNRESDLFLLLENYSAPKEDNSVAKIQNSPSGKIVPQEQSADKIPHIHTKQEYKSAVSAPIKANKRRAHGVVIITADTLRADHLSCYGNENILTPYLDRLAANGVLFRQTISSCTTTTPSHASIFTGLYLQDHNAYSNYEAISDEALTIFEQAYGRGYKTFAIANMPHLNPEVSNIVQGVETFINGNHPRRAAQTFKLFLDWLDTVEPDQPYLAWIHLVDVHTPYRPPAPYNRFYYEGDESDPDNHSLEKVWSLLPTHMSDHPYFQRWLEGITDVRYVNAQYQGAVSYLDDEIGEFIKELENRQRLQDTAIVFTADHGESLGEHNMYYIHYGLYEQTMRVPLIMYLPGMTRSGVVVDEIVQTVDIMPTILDYLKLPIPQNLRGISLLPAMRGELLDPDRTAFIEHAGGAMAAIRSSRYKYIRHLKYSHVVPAYNLFPGKEELYDIENDPNELHNIAMEQPVLAKKFRAILAEKRQSKLNMTSGEPTIDRKTEEMLKSLGYIRN